MNIDTLDLIVLKALDFFIKTPPKKFDVNKFISPFVVGSGNAYNTGTILFSRKDATFADESNFRLIIEKSSKKNQENKPKDVVVISASGGKDSVWEIELAKKHGLKTTLLTTKKNSQAAMLADEVLAFQSIPEPYTYNTSTYIGMIIGATNENPLFIKKFIENIKIPDNFQKYESFSFILPDRFMQICPMLDIKKSELFGPFVSLRAFSQGHARHAKFVIRTPKELVITLGEKNKFFGEPSCRWDINIPPETNFATIMAITYYIVGKIQAFKPPYFKNNIVRYVNEDGPRSYGKSTKTFDLIVPGSE